MPIPREQFDEGLDDTSYKVIDFLKSRTTEAFEVNEVTEGVFTPAPGSKQPGPTSPEMLARSKRMEFFLADLVQKGMVDKRTIGDKTYYCIHKD
jgi:hypothetical protein